MSLQAVLDEIRERPGTGDVIPVVDPATEEQVTEFNDCGPEAVDDAVARAKASFESGVWRDQPPSERAKILWRVGELIDQNAELLAELESLNAGMTPLQAQGTVTVGSEFFRYYAGWCTKIEGIAADVHTGGLTGIDSHQHAYTLKEPYGVVGLIFPWNGPVFNFCAKLAPSLAAGCSSVVKPAEETPLSALVLDNILHEAGVPEGVANLLLGYGHTAGAAITAHPGRREGRLHRLDRSGPGDRARGGREQPEEGHAGARRQVAGGRSSMTPTCRRPSRWPRSAPSSTPVRRVCADHASSCSAASLTSSSSNWRTIANGLPQGGPKDEGSLIGPLISQKQLTRVMGYLDQGKSDGVEVVTGGHRLDRKGYFVHPTVLTNVASTSRLFQEEIFGPVVAVIPFDDEDEAVALANDSTYGLAATAWTTQPWPRTPDCQAAQGRNRRAELPDAVRPLHALRRIQAVRLGLRVRQSGSRYVPANENRLGADVTQLDAGPPR